MHVIHPTRLSSHFSHGPRLWQHTARHFLADASATRRRWADVRPARLLASRKRILRPLFSDGSHLVALPRRLTTPAPQVLLLSMFLAPSAYATHGHYGGCCLTRCTAFAFTAPSPGVLAAACPSARLLLPWLSRLLRPPSVQPAMTAKRNACSVDIAESMVLGLFKDLEARSFFHLLCIWLAHEGVTQSSSVAMNHDTSRLLLVYLSSPVCSCRPLCPARLFLSLTLNSVISSLTMLIAGRSSGRPSLWRGPGS